MLLPPDVNGRAGHFLDHFGGSISDSESGGIVSAITGGAIVGAAAVCWLGDFLGRRWTIFTGSVISVFGCALQAGTTTIAMMIAGRFIAGIALGLLTSTIPMYCAELSEKSVRGAMSGLLQWMLSWGFLCAQWIGYGCSFVNGDFPWRFPLAFQCIPGLILAVGCLFLLESPRWLCEKNRNEDGKAVLQKLRSGLPQETIELEYREIVDVIAADRANLEINWKTIITRPSWRRRLLLGCGVQFFCQLSGINVINYYGARIYEALGIGTQTSLMIIGISGALSIVYATVGLWLLERIGRIKPLIVSAIGMAACLATNAAPVAAFQPGHPQHAPRLGRHELLRLALLHHDGHHLVGVSRRDLPRADPRQGATRPPPSSTGPSISSLRRCRPWPCRPSASSTFYVFFCTNLISAVCYFFFYPETKGKTLEQMDEVFGDQVVPHVLEDPEGAELAKARLSVVELEKS
ncbi:hypothetical protein G647_00169 [Cladophialophora carrionii CBS 160.54]|uniref:Major facilitator superfamily (MFS) profile domain-containing protein n=1 Tax=Cladophialophora carrionii CBS 160.54 TaxID=1279043 RepID=V9DLI5_9EURO|nr:uncharacterized protein G647_00169 [Cladophialophora carrionii CBS 160.54]ETI27720.1 hypothetical protein G647_00169 [Cladophialophora carrionii CBS 160.54]